MKAGYCDQSNENKPDTEPKPGRLRASAPIVADSKAGPSTKDKKGDLSMDWSSGCRPREGVDRVLDTRFPM